MCITARPTLEDGQRIALAAYRLMTARATPTDLRTLQEYRRSNDRDTANAARFFLNLWAGDSVYDALPSDVEPPREPGNVVSITAHQTAHDLAQAFRSMDACAFAERLGAVE